MNVTNASPLSYESETAKHREMTVKYCYLDAGCTQPACGLDIGSQGEPIVPWAWQMELPELQFRAYNAGHTPRGPIQLSGDGTRLPVSNDSLDFVYSSHLLEDYIDWEPVLLEWCRVLKPGGKLIILLPEKNRWAAALAAGQPGNPAHHHEATLGELSALAKRIGLIVLEERFTDVWPGDYNILFVGQRPGFIAT